VWGENTNQPEPKDKKQQRKGEDSLKGQIMGSKNNPLLGGPSPKELGITTRDGRGRTGGYRNPPKRKKKHPKNGVSEKAKKGEKK